MGDARPTLLPPSQGSFISATPSGLTPNSRSEAEAALSLNSLTQTDSAAPTTPLVVQENRQPGANPDYYMDDTVSEAQRAYRRPGGPVRTSSANYETALREFQSKTSASSSASHTSADTVRPGDIAGTENVVQSPVSASGSAFPAPGQGVVPLHTGIGAGQAEQVKKAKPSGLTLGQLARQQSWSEQDRRHVLSARLMEKVDGDAGYASGNEQKGPGEG